MSLAVKLLLRSVFHSDDGSDDDSSFFGGDDDSSSDDDHKTCPTKNLTTTASQPFVGDLSFWTFNKYLSGGCLAFVVLVIALHQLAHANRFSNPSQQSKIMKVAVLIPTYASISYLCLCFPNAYVYLNPWIDLFEANAMVAYFLLVCDYVSPSPEGRDTFFSLIDIPGKSGKPSQKGITWFRRRWVTIFQLPIVAFLVAVATDITEGIGIYCEYLTEPYYAKLWLEIISYVSLGMAIMSVLKFTIQMKGMLVKEKIMLKLVAFKAVVFLTLIQSIIFLILNSQGVLEPTDMLTYADLNIGIPSMIIILEMVPLSLFVVYAYPVKPYILRNKGEYTPEENGGMMYHPTHYQGGPLGVRALFEMFNPADIFKGFKVMFMYVSNRKTMMK